MDRPLVNREATRPLEDRVSCRDAECLGNRFTGGRLADGDLEGAGSLAGVGILDGLAFAPYEEPSWNERRIGSRTRTKLPDPGLVMISPVLRSSASTREAVPRSMPNSSAIAVELGSRSPGA